MFQDLRYSARMLFKNPAFTALAVFTMALGIGANTAVFSIISAVLYPPLRVKEPQRLVSIYGTIKSNYAGTSFPDYLDYRDRSQSYEELAAYGRVPMKLRAGGETKEIGTELVTGNFFAMLGVGAAMGRMLIPDDDHLNRAVAVVSHRAWQERYGGDKGLIGRAVNLNGQEFIVVGIAPQDFSGILLDWGKQPEVWIPLAQHLTAFRGADVLHKRENRWLMVIGRLKSGYSLVQAEAETKSIAARLATESHQVSEGRSVTLLPTAQTGFWPGFRDEIVRRLTLLETLSALLLCVACFNVANLLLVRAAARRRETSIRLALGAGRWRLTRQWLTESLLLALSGAGAGLLIAVWLMQLPLYFQSPFKVSLAMNPQLDHRALGFTLLIAILTSVIFGLAPAWQSIRMGRIGISNALKDTAGRGQTSDRTRLRSILVVVQVSLSLALIASTGLLVRTIWQIRAIDPGFKADRVLLVGLDLDPREYDDTKKLAFYRQALERVAALPGVEAASLANNVPLSMVGMVSRPVEAEDSPMLREQERVLAAPDNISPGYFATLGMWLISGREFDIQDGPGAPRTVIINQTLARRLWPNRDGVGRRIRVGGEKEPLTVIGIAPDVKYRSLLDPPKPYLYFPLFQHLDGYMTLQVRTAKDPMLAVSAVRQALNEVDRRVFIGEVGTID